MSDLFQEAGVSLFDLSAKVAVISDILGRVITQRQSEYLKDVLSLQTHKSVAIRRKVATNLAKLTNYNPEIILSIQSWQQKESDRPTWLALEATLDHLNRLQYGHDTTLDAQVLTVEEALKILKQTVGQRIFTIEGEISQPKDFYNMIYLDIKGTQDNTIRCRLLSLYLQQINFPLNEGLSVRITGKFQVNNKSSLVFEIKTIQLTGQGLLLRNLELLNNKLTAEGLFDPARKRPVNTAPANILLIASNNSAALGDYIKVLSERRTGIKVYQLPIKTQGVGAEQEILSKLAQVNDLVLEYNIDTIVITRGGGSKDDLFVFNSEQVVRAIHGLSRPTIVAIGHEQDVTLSEKVADLRASTPSNAAELSSISNNQILSTNLHLYNQALTFCQERVNRAGQYQQNNQILVQRYFFERVNYFKQVLAESGPAMLSLIYQANEYLDQNLERTINQLQLRITNHKNAIENQYQLLASLQPSNILSYGYTLIRQNNQIIAKSSELDPSAKISIQFQDKSVEL
ncbi:MAG: exodeoxyribonuclease VII large subunit [Candidatus Parcubacteria bacterium]|nr:exodeoxyribonuclease VII large subunit [Candidatus Paceibacterota bacterium]